MTMVEQSFCQIIRQKSFTVAQFGPEVVFEESNKRGRHVSLDVLMDWPEQRDLHSKTMD